MKPRRSALLIGLAALSSLATGCLRSPDVQLLGLRLRGLGFRGATLVAELRIDNPNVFAIQADSLSYDLEASDPVSPDAWASVTRGTSTERIVVYKKSRTIIDMPIDLPYAGLRTPIRSLIDRGAFNYRLSGTVFVRKPLPKRVPFTATGRSP